MAEFDKPQFEFYMSQGVNLHNQKQYDQALGFATLAYRIAPEDSSERGRAARDMSARYDRLGMFEDAESSADVAFDIHDRIVEGMNEPTREALRERSVTAMYVGVGGLRKVIKARLDHQSISSDECRDMMRLTWSDLKDANRQASGLSRYIDQYQINAARRVSISESIVGSRKKGLGLALGAIALGFWSQSKMLDRSDPDLSTKKRFEAKAKAVAGGGLALRVNVLAILLETRLALKFADKAL